MNYQEKQKAVDRYREALSKGLYSKDELEIIIDTFFDNEELITAIRNHFFQFKLTDKEQEILKAFVPTDAYSILYKTFLPELNPDTPVGQSVDLWVSINTKEKLPEDSILEMKARIIVVSYLEEQFNRMFKGREELGDIQLSDLVYVKSKDTEAAYIELNARNEILRQINGNLLNLRNIAFQNKTKMNPDEINKMLVKNSNK